MRLSGSIRVPSAICCDGHIQRPYEDDSGVGGSSALKLLAACFKLLAKDPIGGSFSVACHANQPFLTMRNLMWAKNWPNRSNPLSGEPLPCFAFARQRPFCAQNRSCWQ